MINFPNYCNIADLDDRLSMYHMMNKFVVSHETKYKHQINGWVCICGVLPDDSKIKLYDIWCGFNFENLGGIISNLESYQQ